MGTGDGIFPGDICRWGKVAKRQKLVIRGTNSRRLIKSKKSKLFPGDMSPGIPLSTFLLGGSFIRDFQHVATLIEDVLTSTVHVVPFVMKILRRKNTFLIRVELQKTLGPRCVLIGIEHHEAEEAEVNPVCIFTVPQVLLATNPESYIPQQVALGPFHHKRLEVHDMQKYKLAAARRAQQHVSVSIERIVETMKESDEARIRACYHKSIDMSADALIWMMIVDMAYLLEFLEVYNIKEERRLSPFKEKVLADVEIDSCDHLLDFLYHLTVPKREELGIMETEIDIGQTAIIEVMNEGGEAQVTTLCHRRSRVLMIIKEDNIHAISSSRRRWLAEPIWKKFKVPSSTEMVVGGITCSPVNGGIYDIRFDDQTSTLYLPVIDLDINTEVFLRNLVAYEACIASGPSVVARYTELMNMIIDTEEDAKYLREKGIVCNHLKSDKEVANIWNTMNKSVKLTKFAKMDKVIMDVNMRHGRTWKVKFANFMHIYVFGSWKFLTAFGAMFLTAFCALYSCGRVTTFIPGNFQGGANNRTINGIRN
ncbi:putative UPF0481 protein [Tanacetum coccineum]|uniref:UPF0481 protein n=1 Tax=Tanacetum coccineum TaxID=301880 RepID=A0ABQ5IEZ5_9ASTR